MPAEFLTHTNNIAQFEFDVDQISIAGALFGLVYRYAVRRDNNPQLRQGVVGAFAITRSVATVRVSASASRCRCAAARRCRTSTTPCSASSFLACLSRASRSRPRRPRSMRASTGGG